MRAYRHGLDANTQFGRRALIPLVKDDGSCSQTSVGCNMERKAHGARTGGRGRTEEAPGSNGPGTNTNWEPIARLGCEAIKEASMSKFRTNTSRSSSRCPKGLEEKFPMNTNKEGAALDSKLRK